MLNAPSLRFSKGRCVEVQAPEFASETINAFFANITAHYRGKTPAEIAKHARGMSEAVKDWPAPRDAMLGWALTQSCVRMQLDQYAAEAEEAAKGREEAA